MKTDIIVVGAGPVGLFTVFEAGILGLNCILIDNLDKPGGQCAELYPDKPIYDIPGVPYQTGQEHVDALLKQIEPFNYKLLLNQRVNEIIKDGNNWIVKTSSNEEVTAPNIFIAAGAGSFEPIKPNIPSDYSSLENKKVFYSIKDKKKFIKKSVAIFGGGDSALDWTLELSKIGADVSLIHRRDAFRGAPDTEQKVRELAEKNKINMLTPFILNDLKSKDGKCNAELIDTKTKDLTSHEFDYVVFLYGLNKKLGPLLDWGLDNDGKKIIVDTEAYETNQEGIFAVGDINHYPGKLNLILSGFHETTLAVQKAFKRIYPEERVPFGYTTSNTKIHERLGIKSE